ncbi:hypothetical protein KEG38_24735 [Polyangium jinanense]|uniref:hypothetical protein n=1 Tax=Polyangium jinanense TaxID=2829994 RepID=UPI00233FECF1|nr:hypothetical protein [Polyangium jinanense]MDC3957092.1 hypothetical protein [Polyangium jinanense]
MRSSSTNGPGLALVRVEGRTAPAGSGAAPRRGEGDYPLDIKGSQLLRVEPLLWTQSTGMYFHEYPRIDSIDGLFIQAGVDARTGMVNGVAISRVWT